MQKIIVIVGPTASGKSHLAVRIARAYKGEVISADSRQVYRGLDLGTGKITKREMRGIPHHMLDVANPSGQFSAAQFVAHARRAIREIATRGHLPIIAGGTAFWIDALVSGMELPPVPPDLKLRKKLEKKSAVSLLAILKKLDPRRAAKIEQKNPRRLIRAIEIARTIGSVPLLARVPVYNALWIGIAPEHTVLADKIKKRLDARLRRGMIAEASNLHARGLSWKRFSELGLEYGFLADLLRKKISRPEFEAVLSRAILQYAKRQMTWFRRNKEIVWNESPSQMRKRIDSFLKNL